MNTGYSKCEMCSEQISVRRETLNTRGVKCVSDRDFGSLWNTGYRKCDMSWTRIIGPSETLGTGPVKCVSDNECCIDVKHWTLDV